MKKKIKIVVTGANGQLALTLKDQSKNTMGIDWQFYNSKELDITNKHQVENVFSNQNINYCINCAAYTNVEKAEEDEEMAFKVNFRGVKNIVDTLKNTTTVLIQISTDYVFDGKKENPYTEEDQTNPINVYGKSKLAGEEYIQKNFRKYFIIRTSWLYSEYDNNFLRTVLNKLKSNQKMDVITSQKGTPTSCSALSEFILHIVSTKEKSYGLYHFSAKGNTTWYGFAKHIQTEFFPNKEALIKANDSYKSIASRPKNSILNTTKAQQIFNKIETWDIEVEETVKKIIN